MNYYERHIGDYLKDTAHLSLLEHGIYGRLLDIYYSREAGLPADQIARLVGARSEEEKNALGCVLAEFFVLEAGGLYVQARCAEEIARFRSKQAQAQHAARASVAARQASAEQALNGRSTDVERTLNVPSNQTPVTSNQEEKETASPLRVEKPAPPPCFDGQNAGALNGKHVVALALNWDLPDEWGLDAEALGWRPNEVLVEAEKFRQYWTAGKGAGTRRAVKGWRQAWSNWLGKAAERKLR